MKAAKSEFKTYSTANIMEKSPENIKIVQAEWPLEKALANLQKKGATLITAEQLAAARIRLGKDHPISMSGILVAENCNYLPNGDLLIASSDYNPILKHPKKVTPASHPKHRVFSLDTKILKELRERAEKNPEKAIKSGVLFVPKKAIKYEVPVFDLENYAITQFLFRKQAHPYWQFLSSNGTPSMPLWLDYTAAVYAKKQKKPFARPLCVHNLSRAGSGLVSDYDNRMQVLGVRNLDKTNDQGEKQ